VNHHDPEIPFYVYTDKTDTFAFGTSLAEMFSPEVKKTMVKLITRRASFEGSDARYRQALQKDLTLDSRVKEIIMPCLSRNPDDRPKMQEVVEQLDKLSHDSDPSFYHMQD
jgi:serine/threonine protein kinase